MPMTKLQPAADDPKNCFRYRDQETGEAVEVEVCYVSHTARRGIYLTIKPVTISEGAYSFNLMSLRQYRVRFLNRASPRVLREIAEAVDPRVEELAATFRQDSEAGYAAAQALAESLQPQAA
jgi:isopentenyldiphosphate isomerase